MNYAQRKALGLILSAADRKEAEEIARVIKARTADTMGDNGWERADRTPAIAAMVRTLVHGNQHTPADMLEQFYLYAEGSVSLPRGGRIWIRHNRVEPLTDAMRAAIKVHGSIDGRAILRGERGAATTEALGMLALLIALALVSFVAGLHVGQRAEQATIKELRENFAACSDQLAARPIPCDTDSNCEEKNGR